MKLAPLRRVVLRELLDRSELSRQILGKWVRTGDTRDRVRASTIAEYLLGKRDDVVMSWKWRAKCRRAITLAGFRKAINYSGRIWILCIRERG